MANENHLRILDAAANRAAEGLRVVEDYVRFVLDDGHLTRLTKQLRHDLARACSALPTDQRHSVRDTQLDVGTQITTATEAAREDASEVCRISCERVKQSLRSLEEYGKLLDAQFAKRIEALRYTLYTVERSLGITEASRLRLRDTNLCVLIDGQDAPEAFTTLVQQFIDARVGMIQLRDKRLGDAELVERGRIMSELASSTRTDNPSWNPSLQGRGTMVIINDRPDIAALVDADGVHLGQGDMRVKDARTIVGPRKLIGVSTHHIEQSRKAVLDGANYLGAGPTFPSSTKSFDEFSGLNYLKQVAGEIRLPKFAIGGIDATNVEQVLATGIKRIAVSGAVVQAERPGDAVRELLRLIG